MSGEQKKLKRATQKRKTNSEAKTVRKRVYSKEKKIEKKESKPNIQLKPKTEPPNAVVLKRHHLLVKQRSGKGFSIGELKAIGLSLKHALKLRLKVYKSSKTVHEWNVKALQLYLGIKAV